MQSRPSRRPKTHLQIWEWERGRKKQNKEREWELETVRTLTFVSAAHRRGSRAAPLVVLVRLAKEDKKSSSPC